MSDVNRLFVQSKIKTKSIAIGLFRCQKRRPRCVSRKATHKYSTMHEAACNCQTGSRAHYLAVSAAAARS
jgi:hypothetical protein